MKRIFFAVMALCIPIIFHSNAQIKQKNEANAGSYQLNPDSVTFFSGIEKSLSTEEVKMDTISLPFIKNDFIVNSFDGEYGADQNYVSTAIDGNGNYAFTWVDYRNGKKDIYAQFFNANDERVGFNIMVSDSIFEENNYPFIASNKNGNFVIVWAQNNYQVKAQLFNEAGQKIGSSFTVNLLGGYATNPSAAVNSDGSFLVTWGYSGIYARIFDSTGIPITSDIPISEIGSPSSNSEQAKTVACDTSGNYYIVWASNVNSFSDIYLQKITNNGERIGTNLLVSNSNDSTNKYLPEIGSTNDGHFLISWLSYGNYPIRGGIKIRIFHTDGYFVTNDILLSSDSYWEPCKVASIQDSIFLVFWNGNGYSYIQKINSDGELIDSAKQVKYNTSYSFYSSKAGLTNMVNNHFFIAPEFYQRNDQNIYVQKFNIDLEPVGSLNKILGDSGTSNQTKSLVKYNSKGESIVLWTDERNGRLDLYAQVYDQDFNPVGSNIQINETDAENWFLYDKKVECLTEGTFVIAFSCSEFNGNSNIFLQLMNSSGEKIGNNVRVNEGDYYNYNVSLQVNNKDEVLICWYDQYGAALRKYDKGLSPISSENHFMREDAARYNPLAISIDSAFNIFAVWKAYGTDGSPVDNFILGRFFDEAGNSTSEIFFVDSTTYSYYYISNLQCMNVGKSFAVVYNEYDKIKLKRRYFLDKEYVFGNLFNNSYYAANIDLVEFNNQKILLTFNTPTEILAFYGNDNKRERYLYQLHTYPNINNNNSNDFFVTSADLLNDKLFFAYESSIHGETGYDIWANVRKIENIDFGKENFLIPSTSDILYPNYPNPFNSRTKIIYEILAYHKVKLAVYDILGREVKVLVDAPQEKGVYEVEFDAAGLASGIYFCRLEAFTTSVKKLVHLK